MSLGFLPPLQWFTAVSKVSPAHWFSGVTDNETSDLPGFVLLYVKLDLCRTRMFTSWMTRWRQLMPMSRRTCTNAAFGACYARRLWYFVLIIRNTFKTVISSFWWTTGQLLKQVGAQSHLEWISDWKDIWTSLCRVHPVLCFFFRLEQDLQWKCWTEQISTPCWKEAIKARKGTGNRPKETENLCKKKKSTLALSNWKCTRRIGLLLAPVCPHWCSSPCSWCKVGKSGVLRFHKRLHQICLKNTGGWLN